MNYKAMDRSVFPIPFAIILSVLHVGCCVLPLFSIAVSSSTSLDLLAAYKPILTGIQLLFFFYITFRLISHYSRRKRFHGWLEMFSYHLSLLIVSAGLITAYDEPFKTEEQAIAQQQFHFFKTHRQLELDIVGEYDPEKLKSDMYEIKGIKPGRVRIDDGSISVTFHSGQISARQIMQSLQNKGYVVGVSE